MNAEHQRDIGYPKLKARFGRKEALALLGFPAAMALIACAKRIDAAEAYRMFLPLTTNNYDALKITPIPDTRPCSPWPPEMAVQRRNLSILEGVCYARYTDRSQIPYPDISNLLTVDGSGNADWERRMVHVLASDEVYNQRGIHLVGHEFFHLHQVRTVQDNNLQPPWQEAYFNTGEGRAFGSVLGTVLTNTPNRQQLVEYYPEWAKWLGEEYGRNKYEDAADIASIWYNNPDWIRSNAWTPMREFATLWWPK